MHSGEHEETSIQKKKHISLAGEMKIEFRTDVPIACLALPASFHQRLRDFPPSEQAAVMIIMIQLNINYTSAGFTGV